MKPNEGRLQTAEHILNHIVEKMVLDYRMVICRFSAEQGVLEVECMDDLTTFNRLEFQDKVNRVIAKNLPVKTYNLPREEADKRFDLSRLPPAATEIRIVDIEGFDARPCRDPHVSNTSQIGRFELVSVEKVGKNRYRFAYKVHDNEGKEDEDG
jgi:Ser-tRNA(Ala) deacylase AlaX